MSKNNEFERETYPLSDEEEKILHKETNAFLEKMNQQEDVEDVIEVPINELEMELEVEKEESIELEQSSLTEDENENENENENKEEIKQESFYQRTSEFSSPIPMTFTPEKKLNGNVKVFLVGFVSAVAFFLAIGLLGHNIDVKKSDGVSQEIKKDYAVHNVVASDELYDSKFTVKEVDKRIDGFYVTFEATNDSEYPVYLMANTIKLVTKDGEVILPELGKGDFSSTFTGGGLAIGTTEECTFVFKAGKEAKIDYFLLENVTNLHNGSWTFKIEMK